MVGAVILDATIGHTGSSEFADHAGDCLWRIDMGYTCVLQYQYRLIAHATGDSDKRLVNHTIYVA